MTLKNNIKFLIVVAVIVLAALGIAAGLAWKGGESGASEYAAVYLVTGDVYFGKLSWFPHPRMTNVWLLERGVNAQNQPQLGITPFKNAVWGPVDEITFSEKQIVFWTRLRSDSPVLKGFENPQSVQPAQSELVPGNSGANSQNVPAPKNRE